MKRVPPALFLLIFVMTSMEMNAFAADKKKSQPDKKKKEEKLSSPAPAAPSEAGPNPAIADTYRDLQEVIRIHQLLQAQHKDQLQEIQRITEQARIHQKLLKEMQTARERAAVKPARVDEILELQKIRLIQQQARENRAYLEKIQAMPQKKKGASESMNPGQAEEKAENPLPPVKKDKEKK